MTAGRNRPGTPRAFPFNPRPSAPPAPATPGRGARAAEVA